MFHQVLHKRIIGDLCCVVVPLWVDVCEDRGCTQEGRGDGSKTCKANSANRRRNANESTRRWMKEMLLTEGKTMTGHSRVYASMGKSRTTVFEYTGRSTSTREHLRSGLTA